MIGARQQDKPEEERDKREGDRTRESVMAYSSQARPSPAVRRSPNLRQFISATNTERGLSRATPARSRPWNLVADAAAALLTQCGSRSNRCFSTRPFSRSGRSRMMRKSCDSREFVLANAFRRVIYICPASRSDIRG